MENEQTQYSTLEKIKGVVRLTRWREHVPFTIPLTLVGALLAVDSSGTNVDWRLLAIVIANILAVAFAFIINDVADAPDDALDPRKKAHNVISSGVLSYRTGMILSGIVFAIALLLYATSGWWVVIWGGATLILCYMYSAYPWRLKARPITDVVSHALMLSALLVMTGYFAYDSYPEWSWLVILAAFLFSAYGQFYNQVDDYEVDKEAGLKNTVVLLGKTPTKMLSIGSAIGAIICLAVAIWMGLFPDWLGVVLLISVFAAALFPWELDMRGNKAVQGAGIQRPALLVANVVTLFWLASEIGLLTISA